ncbi:ADP-ribosylglycohydrolase family protein [Pseudoalteromonas sp. SWXJZ94C]|uniref:ADP-ribosylglycohydrolase family protein n=1 Tax=Pseudoalteromonas sp. SWXJZ94C TaxID=2792065 RepID=UPI0018CEE8FF|nr:ADP-ribosylglycohydrolase family protein [Pseudoalteromonas sp. SWXJZ94C]MBH0058498.1 ADP-ribosylglycohydrolase family protein [Pseudoalteromonas sp. SWXJZ94C]
MKKILENQIINSALWAAYGDALGFITELADAKILKSRTGQQTIESLVDWKRRVGGKFGTTIKLPKGSYSDDTQLRLATSRAIMGNGHFSIHSFSKIELPVWQSYALGAGRGSKLAASSLSKANVAWYSNFYNSDNVSYLQSGGNGAAMRIQPHVWSAVKLDEPELFLPDVIRNSLTTHGHPRAIIGSVFHALSLSYTLFYKKIPSLEYLRTFNQWTNEVPRIIESDINLNTIWASHYENSSQSSLVDDYEEVYKELEALIDKAEEWYKDEEKTYKSLATLLNLFDVETRGSGTLTSLAASVACLLLEETSEIDLIKTISNELLTDTDSIATMAGAIMGAQTDICPDERVQDQDYIIQESKRLHSISNREAANSFKYPEKLEWKSPSSQLDFLGKANDRLVLFPFGEVKSISTEVFISTNKSYCYEWFESKLGQSFLIKRRYNGEFKKVAEEFLEPQVNIHNSKSLIDERALVQQNLELEDNVFATSIDIDKLTTKIIRDQFDPTTIGSSLLEIANSELGVNGVVAFSAIISKAYVARKRK